MSRNIPFQAVKLAEDCSKFSRQAGLSAARVIYSYRTVRCSDSVWHILSCVRDAGTDYSGRTNHLAQHLMFDSREASACAREGKTPAGVILGTAWLDHDGFCGWIADGVHWDAHEPEPTWQWWQAYAGSGDCRKNLSSEAALRGAVLVYGGGLESQTEEDAKKVLFLYAESQADCPDHGWGVTFTTSLEPNDELSEFRWIGVAEDSPMLPKVEVTGGRTRITFETPPPAPRLPESTGTYSEVRAPDASQSAVLQQQNYGMAGEGDGSKVQRSSVKPPPLGLSNPPRSTPRSPEHAVRRWLKKVWIPLAFSAGLLLVGFFAYIVLFPTPPQIVFLETTFPDYTGKPVQPRVKTIPSGREHEVTIEPKSISKAGETKVTASIKGKWLGMGTNVTGYIIIPQKRANIEFDPPSLKQVWPGDQVSVFVKPEEDEGNGESLADKVELYYKSEDQDELAWSTNKPRPTGSQTNFDVRARISADSNYVGEKRAKLIITTQDNTTLTGALSKSLTVDDLGAPVVLNPTAANRKTSGQDSSLPQESSVKFLLADESQVLPLLPGSMPKDGDLIVESCADGGKSVNINRTNGNWSIETKKGVKTGGFGDELFAMEEKVPKAKKPTKSIEPIDADSPLAYIVADNQVPSFVSIELKAGDNSSVMQRFFQRVYLGKIDGKPLIQFSLTDKYGGQPVGFDQFEKVSNGQYFILKITTSPYDEKDSLQLPLSPNGELEIDGEEKKLKKLQSEAAEQQAARDTARTPFDRAKDKLVEPLKAALTKSSKPDPNEQALIQAIENIALPAGSSPLSDDMLKTFLMAEVFNVLERDSFTSSFVKLTDKRQVERSGKSDNSPGNQPPESVKDFSLLDGNDWNKVLQKTPSNWLNKANEWLTGREQDVRKGENLVKQAPDEEQNRELIRKVLAKLKLGIAGLNTLNCAPPNKEDSERNEKKITARLEFLKKLGSPLSPGLRSEQGRLLLVTPPIREETFTTNSLWPNVLLFGDPVQEAINNDP